MYIDYIYTCRTNHRENKKNRKSEREKRKSLFGECKCCGRRSRGKFKWTFQLNCNSKRCKGVERVRESDCEREREREREREIVGKCNKRYSREAKFAKGKKARVCF